MITWVIEENVFAEKSFNEMVSHFKSNKIPFHTVKIIPFIHELDTELPVINDFCVAYGSIGIQKVAKDNWNPGVWTSDSFNEIKVKEALGKYYLNNNAIICKISEVTSFTDLEQFFIKPDSDNKEFAGTIIELNEFTNWYNNLISIGYLNNNDFDVLISDTKKIHSEWRLIVVNKKIVTYCIYKQYGILKPELIYNKEIENFAKDIIEIYTPADVFVMDIAYTNNGLKVVEYNTFNSAGFYACNVSNIIDSINKYLIGV